MSLPKSAWPSGPSNEDCFDLVVSICDRLGVAWAVAGAVAAMRYRIDERPTNDLDLLIADATGLAEVLVAEGFDVRSYSDEGDV